MSAVKEAVKENLLGATRDPELSAQTRATFERHSRRDGGSGEAYMTEEDFVNAVAPEGEDYVSMVDRRACRRVSPTGAHERMIV